VAKTGTNEEGCRAYHYGGDQHAREFPKYFDLRRSGSSGPNHLFLPLPLSTMRPAQHDWKKRWDWVKNASMNIKTITGNTRGKPPDRICCSTAF